jgi:hypothetical protein
MVQASLVYGHRRELRRAPTAAAGGGLWRNRTTVVQMMQYRAPEMRELTVELSRCSRSTIMDGADRNLADSGELLQRGTANIRWFGPPLLDSFLQEVLGVDAELQSFSVRLRVASSDGDETWPELGFRETMQRVSGKKN